MDGSNYIRRVFRRLYRSHRTPSYPTCLDETSVAHVPYWTGAIKFNNVENVQNLDWENLITTLAKKFKNDAHLSNLRDELHNITQGKDSVGEFAQKIYNKCKFAFQGMDKSLATQMAIDFFIKGLNPQIRKAMRRLPEAKDFDAVVAAAEKEHRVL
ncbi:unnamed protein product [Cylicostephanus goldi]|uniref:Retrotransposon gag domain-containing protein n=1 Tax=Cylicostephanus goldi TaxID=71465 RepID=A0A3P7Q5Q4_CYLGO|nr:unnamed protein product [Cylicostephanus goldi]